MEQFVASAVSLQVMEVIEQRRDQIAHRFALVGLQVYGVPYQGEIGAYSLPFLQVVIHVERLLGILVCQDDVLGRRDEVTVYGQHLEVERVVEFEELQEGIGRDDATGMFFQPVFDEVDRGACFTALYVEYPDFLCPIGLARFEKAVIHAAHAADDAHFVVEEGVAVVGGQAGSVQEVECQVDCFRVFHDVSLGNNAANMRIKTEKRECRRTFLLKIVQMGQRYCAKECISVLFPFIFAT